MQHDTAHSKLILEKLTVPQLVTEFPAYHGTQISITVQWFVLRQLQQAAMSLLATDGRTRNIRRYLNLP